jgi:hypothetical protein
LAAAITPREIVRETDLFAGVGGAPDNLHARRTAEQFPRDAGG